VIEMRLLTLFLAACTATANVPSPEESTDAGVSIVIILWEQGENDAGGSGTSAAYQAKLTELAAYSRSELGADTTWIVGRLNIDYEKAPLGQYTAGVRAGEEGFVAGDTRAYLVDQDPVVPGPDHAHYTADGYVSLGSGPFATDVMADVGSP
jgi:hypothetical protein